MWHNHDLQGDALARVAAPIWASFEAGATLWYGALRDGETRLTMLSLCEADVILASQG